MLMLWIWKNSCTRFALTWSNSTTLQKNALSHEQTSKNKTRKEKYEAGECHTCWGLLWLWGIPQGHWNPRICAKMHPHFGGIWCMASMLAPCDFHPKQKTCASRICGSLDLPSRQIQISHYLKLPMNITHLLMFINLGRSFPF